MGAARSVEPVPTLSVGRRSVENDFGSLGRAGTGGTSGTVFSSAVATFASARTLFLRKNVGLRDGLPLSSSPELSGSLLDLLSLENFPESLLTSRDFFLPLAECCRVGPTSTTASSDEKALPGFTGEGDREGVEVVDWCHDCRFENRREKDLLIEGL
jgi:hypothetical protein